MRAAAVAAVRAVLRVVLARARCPVVPASASIGQRAHDVAGQRADAQEHQHRAEAEGLQRLGGVEVARQAPDEHADARRQQDGRDVRGVSAEAAGGQAGALLHGGDGRHPGRPQRRPDGRRDRDDDADQQGRDHGARLHLDAAGRDPEADRVEQAQDAPCDPDAHDQADQRGHDAGQQGLAHDVAQHLGAGGPQRADHPELPHPLRDRDREGVEDDEGAHEERHAREGEQGRGQEARDLAADVVALRLRVLGRGLDQQVARQGGAHASGELVLAEARPGRGEDVGHLALAVEPALRVGQGDHHDGGAADRLHVAVAEGAHQAHRPGADRRRQRHPALAHLEVLAVGDVLDDGHLARVLRHPALERHARVDGLRDVRDHDRGRPALRADHLAVDHELALGAHLALGAVDAVDRGHPLDHRRGHRRQGVLEAVELGLARDHHVDLGVAGLEDVVEGRVDLVGEDEGPRHHRHAEHDGDGGQRRAQLAGEDAAEDQAEHEAPYSSDLTTS
jgi:hypothetical protein